LTPFLTPLLGTAQTVTLTPTEQAGGSVNSMTPPKTAHSATSSSTPPPTNTPGPTQFQQTVDAYVNLSFTRTAQAQTALTSTANFQSTVSAMINQDLTATGVIVQANL